MLKKLSTLVVAGVLTVPAAAHLAKAATVEELQQRVDELESRIADMEDNSESWDLASRIKLYGDFRFMANYVTADAASFYSAMDIGHGVADFWTTGNVMNSYASVNSGETVGQFAAAFAGATDHGTYYTITGGSGNINVTNDEYAAMQRTFGATVSAILTAGGYMAAPITALTPTFTSLQGLVAFMKSVGPANRQAIFSEMGYGSAAATDYDNDTLYTNRFRLNIRAKATENLEFKGRLAMYKVWGMQNNAVDYTYNNGMGGGPFMYSDMSFDGSSTRQPEDNVLRVDRAFINWNNIADLPVWFSIGRRPVTDGPPAQLRLGADKKMATPVAFMNYPFDGLSLGYAYENLFGIEDLPGRIRICYGRGFESGPTENGDGLNDVDFGGISWDVFKKGDRFFNFQSFIAANMFNVPDNISFGNPVEYYLYQNGQINFDPMNSSTNLVLDRANLGDIYHTSTVYMSKVDDLHYFLAAGWSHTRARGMDELGTSLLGSWFNDPEDKDGYSFYTGVRYDLGDEWRFGLEYNYGTKNWISFTPGHDEVYASKLATRGHVGELYTIWNIPAGEKISKYSKAFMRLGYQYYDYEYTGSGFWLGEPVKIDDLANDPLNAQFNVPVDKMHRVYLSLEAWF